MIRTPKQVAIVGAGLIGQLLALQLARQHCSVTLIDADATPGARSCAQVAAGMLSPWAELDQAEPLIAALGLRSLTQWPVLLGQLIKPVYFQKTGSLLIAHPQDADDFAHRLQRIHHKRQIKQSQHSTDAQEWTSSIERLTPDALTELEPELQWPHRWYAAYLPNEGQIDAQVLMSVLHETLKAMAAQHPHLIQWRCDPTAALAPYHITFSDHQTLTYDLVVDCRGLGAKSTWGHSLRGIRGEVVWLDAPSVTLTRPIRLIHPRYPIYIVPRPDHRYIVGATEIESESMAPITTQSLMTLLSAAYSVHSGFADAHVLKTDVACRPTLAHHRPQLRYEPGFLAINGLYRHGFLIAPALIESILQQLNASFQFNHSTLFSELWECVHHA